MTGAAGQVLMSTLTDRPAVWGPKRPRFLLVIADPDETAASELAAELARHHVDTEVCQDAADALVAAGSLRPDAVLIAAEQPGIASVARPYRLPELIPIMRSIRPESIGTLDPPIERGGLSLDPATLDVRLHGRRIPLPLREYQVLRFLMTHVDRVVTRDQIYEAVWGEPYAEPSNTLTVHIKLLRKRLGDDQKDPHIIVTVRLIGYRLIPPPA